MCTYSMLMVHRGNVSGMQLSFVYLFFFQLPCNLPTVTQHIFLRPVGGRALCTISRVRHCA